MSDNTIRDRLDPFCPACHRPDVKVRHWAHFDDCCRPVVSCNCGYVMEAVAYDLEKNILAHNEAVKRTGEFLIECATYRYGLVDFLKQKGLE